MQRQKSETVRSLVKEYVADLTESRRISEERHERFVKELASFGVYEIELTVYERRRYEGEAGRVYLYSECKATEGNKELLTGSYLRVTVAEQEKGKIETFLYGAACMIIAGGRVP
ncbi:MAG: hypothetical protein IJW37_05965 [Lachnospiraceae bacterium]|nr:hypothetical protein [Lachnospiraceae bacterium]